jgi:hypothetical protein
MRMSNRRKAKGIPRRLTNVEVLEAVEKFVRTGNPGHLPPRLRREADAIFAFAMEGAVQYIANGGLGPWPESAVGANPGPGASIGEIVRALIGDRADDESEFTA